MSVLRLSDVNIYDSRDKAFHQGNIVAENGKITEIQTKCEICDGNYIIPGMVDVHTHGRGGYDFIGASAGGIERMCRSYAEVGTTSLFATFATSTADNYKTAIRNIKKSVYETAHVDGIHFEGRYINAKRKGAHDIRLLSPPDSEELAEFLELSKPFPTHVTAAYELDGGEEFLKTALSYGATAGIGHSDSTYEEAMKFLDMGATSFTHLFNAMRPLHHREPGTVGAGLTSDAYTEIICDGFHLHPSVVKLAYLAKSSEKLVLITDSMEAAGCIDGEYSIAGLPVIVKDGKAMEPNGTIAGSTLSLFQGLKNFAAFCGISLEEAIPYATVNPSKMVGIDKITGSIEVGKRADFLVLGKDKSTIENVYCNGLKIC